MSEYLIHRKECLTKRLERVRGIKKDVRPGQLMRCAVIEKNIEARINEINLMIINQHD